MEDYFANVLAFLARIDEASVSGLLDREMIVEANRLRLETQVVMGKTRVHGAEFVGAMHPALDAIRHTPPDLGEARR
ncbi:hypothetical protein [Pleomorphomonas koreensis]|uniref:hypothetical protein n=1 Tax=Pleomorphomonas koreensis TaxID=257440 RepID=UPI00041FC5F9|nr:hypothetical protein [Pleomorphomonas koreensis]